MYQVPKQPSLKVGCFTLIVLFLLWLAVVAAAVGVAAAVIFSVAKLVFG